MLLVLKKFSCLLEKGQKKRIVFLFVLMFIGALLETLGVGLMLPLISAVMQPDIIETNEMIKWVCDILDLHSHRTFVIACIATLIFVFIFKDLFLMGEYYIQSRFVYNNQLATQKKLLGTLMRRPYEYYLNLQSGEILNVITTNTVETYDLLLILLQFATESIIAVVLSVTILLVDPLMTVFLGIMLSVTMLFIVRIVKPILCRQGLSRENNNILAYQWLLQAIQGVKEIKVAQKERFFETSYDASARKSTRASKWYTLMSNVPRLLIEMISVCSMLLLIAILIFLGREIETLIPVLGAFAMSAVKLLPSANRIVGALNSVAYHEPALDKLLANMQEIKDFQPIKEKNDFAGSEEELPPLLLNREIALHSITYAYPNAETTVLRQVDMSIPIGKSVGIVGASGAGKTTVVDILLGLLIPQQGQVLADGVDVMTNYSSWLSHIGYIPQTIFMLDGSIRENVAFGLSNEEIEDRQIWYALEEAQLAEFVRSLPEGIDTQIGERGMRLSGGQRQRIGIARALYLNPELLIFDEATSALDNETEAAIMESIHSLHGKKTMVIIAHRLQTIEGCDMVYRVADGKITRER